MPLLGFMVSAFIWLNLNHKAQLLGAAWIAIGLILYFVMRRTGSAGMPCLRWTTRDNRGYGVVNRRTKSTHVTLADVARASGFSTSTVSIVLNDAPLSKYVAAKTKEHIRKKAAEMSYHPDALARSLSRRHSQTIGVLVFDISDPFCMSLLRGIERTLYPTTYLPIIMDADNRHEQFDRYLDMLIGRRVEGLILVANWLFAEIETLSQIEKNKIPMTVVGRDLTPRSIRP